MYKWKGMKSVPRAEGRRLAEEHVDWFLKMVRPLLVEYFLHGLKHGAASKGPQIVNIADFKMADEGDW